MDAVLWERMRDRLDRVLDLPKGGREAYLRALDEAEPDIALAVRQLLATEGQPFPDLSVMAVRVFDGETADEDAAHVGQHIGPYRLTRLLGSGGMGAVYLGQRIDGYFLQHVAVKILRGSLAGSARDRFDRERAILATLRHSAIATLFDGGQTRDGAPHFVMEYVAGQPISAYCERHVDSLEGRVKLCIQVAQALAYAHANLVVHRDIKPTNILVTPEGQAKLLDFGIAKLLASPSPDAFTQGAVGPMTPEFAAPEQFLGGQITASTDIYQFGVLLYHTVSGRLPYKSSPADPVRFANDVVEGPYVSLRQSLSTTDGAGAQWPARSMVADLNAIIRTCVAKDPQKRYRSMDSVVADLSALLDARPVSAQPPSRRYLAARFISRHRVGTALAALGLVTVLAALVAALFSADTARNEALRADASARRAEQISAFLVAVFREVDPLSKQTSADLSVDDLVERSAVEAKALQSQSPDLHAELGAVIGELQLGIGRVADAEVTLLDAKNNAGPSPDSLVLARLNGQLGLAKLLLGDAQGGRPLLESAIAMAEASPRPLDQILAARLKVPLARLLATTRDRQRAAPLLHQAYSTLVTQLGHDNPDAAIALAAYADALREQRRNNEAMTLLEDSVGALSTIDASHPRLIHPLLSLRELYKDAGQFELAEDAARKALAIAEAKLAPEHPLMGHAVTALAKVYSSAEQFKRALAIIEPWRAMAERWPGQAQVAFFVEEGQVRYGLSQFEAARAAFHKACALHRASAGDNDAYTWYIVGLEASALLGMGRAKEAEALQRSALERGENILGEDDYRVVHFVEALADTLSTSPANFDEEIVLRRRALKIASNSYPDSHRLRVLRKVRLAAALRYSPHAADRVEKQALCGDVSATIQSDPALLQRIREVCGGP